MMRLYVTSLVSGLMCPKDFVLVLQDHFCLLTAFSREVLHPHWLPWSYCVGGFFTWAYIITMHCMVTLSTTAATFLGSFWRTFLSYHKIHVGLLSSILCHSQIIKETIRHESTLKNLRRYQASTSDLAPSQQFCFEFFFF